MNKVILLGRLVRDPEHKVIKEGISVTTFTVAVNRRFKPSEADFINCVAWRNTAEFIAKYFNKGKMIGIVGSLQVRSYKDKDGNNRTVTEVVADEAYFAGESKANGNGSDFEEVADDVELPF